MPRDLAKSCRPFWTMLLDLQRFFETIIGHRDFEENRTNLVSTVPADDLILLFGSRISVGTAIMPISSHIHSRVVLCGWMTYHLTKKIHAVEFTMQFQLHRYDTIYSWALICRCSENLIHTTALNIVRYLGLCFHTTSTTHIYYFKYEKYGLVKYIEFFNNKTDVKNIWICLINR